MTTARRWVYQLTTDDIAMAAGGPMGSPVVTLATVLYATPASAMRAAERDAARRKLGPVQWNKSGRGAPVHISSNDLGSVMYSIDRMEVKP